MVTGPRHTVIQIFVTKITSRRHNGHTELQDHCNRTAITVLQTKVTGPRHTVIQTFDTKVSGQRYNGYTNLRDQRNQTAPHGHADLRGKVTGRAAVRSYKPLRPS